MKFQISNIVVDGKSTTLSYPTFGNENVFTILVGKNASGKTKILSKIANSYIFNKEKFIFQREIFEANNSQQEPSQVIAVSNSRFDRFPDPYRSIFSRDRYETHSNQKVFDVDYHYLGLGSYRSSPHIIISNAVAPIINGLENNKKNPEVIAKMLDYIGFLPAFHIELKRSRPAKEFYPKLYPQELISLLYEEFQHACAFHKNKSIRIFNFEEEILPGLLYFTSQNPKNKSLSYNIDLVNDGRENREFYEISKYLPSLIECGLFTVTKFSLFNKTTKDKLPMHLASSGQQCMLLMFFGMAGVIKDGSLICIDEPEISLHPRWQAEFIETLQNSFSKYRGCHFVIATHSPQIVSGLDSENGFVADLESGETLLLSAYSKKSADFQLAQIFHEPGFKNEYIIRILLVILSKLAKRESPTEEDLIKLEAINKIQHRLEDSDPVLHIFHQVKMLIGKK